MPKALTDRQAAYIREFQTCGNKTKAYLAAGYPTGREDKDTISMACRVHKSKGVQKALGKAVTSRENKEELAKLYSMEWLRSTLMEVYEQCKEKNKHGDCLRAIELIGRTTGAFIDGFIQPLIIRDYSAMERHELKGMATKFIDAEIKQLPQVDQSILSQVDQFSHSQGTESVIVQSGASSASTGHSATLGQDYGVKVPIMDADSADSFIEHPVSLVRRHPLCQSNNDSEQTPLSPPSPGGLDTNSHPPNPDEIEDVNSLSVQELDKGEQDDSSDICLSSDRNSLDDTRREIGENKPKLQLKADAKLQPEADTQLEERVNLDLGVNVGSKLEELLKEGDK